MATTISLLPRSSALLTCAALALLGLIVVCPQPASAFLVLRSSVSSIGRAKNVELVCCEASSSSTSAATTTGIINVALAGSENRVALEEAMLEHPLLAMIDVTANIIEVPSTPSAGDDNDNKSEQEQQQRFGNDLLQDVGVACFASPEEVKQWVTDVDVALGIEDTAEEDKRWTNGNVMAACIGTETARVCLESGRWEARNIYYAKGEEDSVQGWAASAVQAVGDLNERNFWGEGAW
jgi:hypothetical protein